MAGSGGVCGAQAAGAEPGALAAGARGPAEVALGAGMTDGAVVGGRDFRKESGWFPGTRGSAFGPWAVAAESPGGPVDTYGGGGEG